MILKYSIFLENLAHSRSRWSTLVPSTVVGRRARVFLHSSACPYPSRRALAYVVLKHFYTFFLHFRNKYFECIVAGIAYQHRSGEKYRQAPNFITQNRSNKVSLQVAGTDKTWGYAGSIHFPSTRDAPTVEMLKQLGKTTCISLEKDAMDRCALKALFPSWRQTCRCRCSPTRAATRSTV